jgi:hypothetical protein
LKDTVYFPIADGKYYVFLGRLCVSYSPIAFIEFASVYLFSNNWKKKCKESRLDVALTRLLVLHRLSGSIYLKIYNVRATFLQRFNIEAYCCSSSNFCASYSIVYSVYVFCILYTK